MRKIGKEITTDKMVQVKEIAVIEELANYSVNKTDKLIGVTVEFKSEEAKVIGTESYVFEGEDFKEEVTTEYLWMLIDRERELKISI